MDNLAVNHPSRRVFPISVEMYHLMAENGIFHPDDRVELIQGEIFDMSPIGNRHARCVKFLASYLIPLLQGHLVVGIQDPIVLADDSEPQPDISLLEFREDLYIDELPREKNVVAVIEVADSSVDFDRNTKFRRYAAAGIQEAWLVDLTSDRIEIHAQPKETGYSLVRIYSRGERISSEKIPAIQLLADDVLGGSPHIQ